jgi:hypothetical protein
MILLDTDTFSLHQVGHDLFLRRFEAASEVPAITIVTRIEALRGRHKALLKAKDGPALAWTDHHGTAPGPVPRRPIR